MALRNDASEMDRLIDTLRGIIGALNANGLGTGESIPVALARVETRLDHLEKATANTHKLLMGLVISVVSLVIKMIVEGVFLR
ncbi:MAG: hypothetical protein LBQ90_05080 [Synergistaceae bacterium]|jgi:hypothetical protein|nr:hypothetical protein [Synergistaceae bacterium]